jgi:hypothetical protein
LVLNVSGCSKSSRVECRSAAMIVGDDFVLVRRRRSFKNPLDNSDSG